MKHTCSKQTKVDRVYKIGADDGYSINMVGKWYLDTIIQDDALGHLHERVLCECYR